MLKNVSQASADKSERSLDKQLVEYTFSLPGKYKIGYFSGKKLIKEAFKNTLPRWSSSIGKKGFEVPIADWLKGNFFSLLNDTCSKNSLEKMGIINTKLVNDWKEELISGKRDTSWQLWTLITYRQWLESRGLL